MPTRASDLVTLGLRIRHFRSERGLTLDQLGDQVGLAGSQLSLIENGRREPKLSTLQDVATALAVPVTELLSGEAPNTRAALEIELARAQKNPLYGALGLPTVKVTKGMPVTALESLLGLHRELARRASEAIATPEEARRANTELRAGDRLDVMSPQGTFTTALDTLDDTHIVGIAAGSGITPLMSLAHTVLERSTTSRFTLVYTNRTALDVMFLDELADLKDRYPARLALHHVLSRQSRSSALLSGRIDEEKLRLMLASIIRPVAVDEWFLCGPFELVQLCRDTLESVDVDPRHIRFELFTTGEPAHAAGDVGRPVIVGIGDKTYEIEFTLDGESATVTTPVNAKESILNAALRVRPDVPFACAGGVCGTCRAKLVSGDVTMTENYALEPDELARGYVLTCQSHPTTDRVVVDYDV